MFRRGLLGIGLIFTLFLSGCTSTTGQVVFGLSRILVDVAFQGKSVKDSASDTAASAIEDKLVEKTVRSSNSGIISGLVNINGQDNKKNIGGVKPSEEAFRQLNQNTSVKKEPESIDLGNGIILTPEDGKSEAKVNNVAKTIVALVTLNPSAAEEELMAEIDKDIKKSDIIEVK